MEKREIEIKNEGAEWKLYIHWSNVIPFESRELLNIQKLLHYLLTLSM